jgi:L-lactate dehydrogenase complex protein LldF
LLAWRKEIADRGLLSKSKVWSMKLASQLLKRPRLYRLAGWFARKIVPRLPRFMVYNRFNTWSKQRELPEFPQESFRQQFRNRKAK